MRNQSLGKEMTTTEQKRKIRWAKYGVWITGILVIVFGSFLRDAYHAGFFITVRVGEVTNLR